MEKIVSLILALVMVFALTSVSALAEAVEEERREVRERFWRETAERLGRDPGNMSDTMAVFYLKNAAAVINRYGAEPEEFTF